MTHEERCERLKEFGRLQSALTEAIVMDEETVDERLAAIISFAEDWKDLES